MGGQHLVPVFTVRAAARAPRLIARARRLMPPVPGELPDEVAVILRHAGLRAAAVDAACDSIFTRRDAAQVTAALAGAGPGAPS